MLSLRNLTEVDLKINHWDVACATRYFVENDLTLLRGLLHGCPNLQVVFPGGNLDLSHADSMQTELIPSDTGLASRYEYPLD